MPIRKAKYRAVADELREQILTGQLAYGDQLPSEAQLMAEYGVGRGTARAAVHILTEDGLVSVRQGARAVVLGRAGSRRNATRVFGVTYHGVVPLFHQYNITVLRGIYSALRDYAHELELIDVSIREGSVFGGPNHYKFRRCEGIFLMAPEPDDPVVRALHGAGKALVTLGIPLEQEGLPIHEVTLDGDRGMENLVRHLIDLGHRKLGVVLVTPYEVHTRRYVNQVALNALHEAVQLHGVQIDRGWIREAPEFTREAGYQAGMELLSGSHRPTAIVTVGDTIALGVRQAAGEVGLSVPKDLSITGVGNYVPELELTTLAVPAFNVGIRAAKIMVSACEGKEISPMAPLPLPVVVGKTTTFASQLRRVESEESTEGRPGGPVGPFLRRFE